MSSPSEIPIGFIFTRSPRCVVCGEEILNIMEDSSEEEIKDVLSTNNFLPNIDYFIDNKLYVVCSDIGDAPCLPLFEGCYISYEDKGIYIDDPAKRKVLEEALGQCRPSQLCV